MESDARRRHGVALADLNAMMTATSSAEFSVAFLGFVTFGRSILDVAGAEAASHGKRHYIKNAIEKAEEDDLVGFFIGVRNYALKRNQYPGMHSAVTTEPQVTIRLHVESGDVLISPSRGIDETLHPPEVFEIQVREKKPAAGAAVESQEFFFATGKYEGQSVIDLSRQFLERLETVVDKLESTLGGPIDLSSGSAR